MDNYNPRQPTRFRFKDGREMEKFKFIADEFNFGEEVLEQASQHEPWCKIVNVIENGIAYKPILIFDEINNDFYFGSQENDTLYLQSLYANQGYIVEIKYTKSTDKLTITITEENYLSEDNLKTIFGQSISGTGNITMYRHDLTFTTGGGDKFVGVVYSSKNLNVNTFDKLAELIGRTGIQNILVSQLTHDNEATKDASNIIVYWFQIGATWIARNNTGTVNIALAEVSDVVRPI